MKRLILALLVLTAAVYAQPAYIYSANPTLRWDVTPTEIWIDLDGDGGDLADLDADGQVDDPIIEPVISVLYEVGYSFDPVVDRLTPTAMVGSTAALELPATVPEGGWVVYALRASYTTASGVSVSIWNWADQPEGTDGRPFWYINPSSILRPPPKGFAGQ